jgi:hypothetical protein
MNEDKEKKNVSISNRLSPLESALFGIGLAFLILGIVTQDVVHMLSGVIIAGGSVALHFVKKKDWKKYWETHEVMLERQRERQRAEREKKDAERGKR